MRALAAFLEAELQKGHSLARSRLLSFTWWGRCFGLPFPFQARELAAFRVLSEEAPAEQDGERLARYVKN